MNSAEHLLVLVSIILSFAIKELLVGGRAAALGRGWADLSALPFLAAILVLIAIVQFWWYLFIVAQRDAWAGNFFLFAGLLLRPSLLFLSAASIFPAPGVGGDLAAHYFRNRRFIYLPLALFETQNLIESASNLGSIVHPAHLFHIVFTAIGVTLAWRSERAVHLTLLPVLLLGAVVFIAIFSLRLG
jgi:hypothetical protein